jgi:hypothetical protein
MNRVIAFFSYRADCNTFLSRQNHLHFSEHSFGISAPGGREVQTLSVPAPIRLAARFQEIVGLLVLLIS